MDGRPHPPDDRRAHVGRLLDRQVGRRHAHGDDDAPEAGYMRRNGLPAQRQGDAERALHPQRQRADLGQRSSAIRSTSPSRTSRAATSISIPGYQMTVYPAPSTWKMPGRRDPALPPGHEPVPPGVRRAASDPLRGGARGRRNDVSGIPPTPEDIGTAAAAEEPAAAAVRHAATGRQQHRAITLRHAVAMGPRAWARAGALVQPGRPGRPGAPRRTLSVLAGPGRHLHDIRARPQTRRCRSGAMACSSSTRSPRLSATRCWRQIRCSPRADPR